MRDSYRNIIVKFKGQCDNAVGIRLQRDERCFDQAAQAFQNLDLAARALAELDVDLLRLVGRRLPPMDVECRATNVRVSPCARVQVFLDLAEPGASRRDETLGREAERLGL